MSFPRCQHRPILPGRRQPSIVGTGELNYRVRNGNGWTLRVKDANYVARSLANLLHQAVACGAPSGIRTRDPLIKSQLLYQLS